MEASDKTQILLHCRAVDASCVSALVRQKIHNVLPFMELLLISQLHKHNTSNSISQPKVNEYLMSL